MSDDKQTQYEKLLSEVKLVVQDREANLRLKPHPRKVFADRGQTLLDYARYVLQFGRIRALKKLRNEIQ